MRRTKTMLMGDLLDEFFSRPYVAARVAEGRLPIPGGRSSARGPLPRPRNCGSKTVSCMCASGSSVLRSELFRQREALAAEINRRSKVRLVASVIIR